jgi:plastocyanin
MKHGTRSMTALAAILALALLGCGGDDDTGTNPPPPNPELDSPTLVGGAQFVHTFANAGTFPYHCDFHAAMQGSITVAAGGDDSLVVHIVNSSNLGFLPQTGTIKPGGYVRWHNMDTASHTVTSN